MAPELISGERLEAEQERVADIYALGISAYELLTGDLPFRGHNWVDIFQSHLSELPARPSEHRPKVPDVLDAIVLKCLAKNPGDRYQSCEELEDALGAVRTMPVTPPPLTAATKSSPRPIVPRTPPSEPKKLRARSTVKTRARILVADPDPSFRALVLQSAEDTLPGSRFHAARTTQTALDIARTSVPLVLIAPVNDPTMNGLEFAAMLRGDESLEQVRLVLTAERITTHERKLLEQLGVFRLLVKPVAREELDIMFRQASKEAERARSARDR